MTASEHLGLDRIVLDHHGADTCLAQLGVIRDRYAEVYAEPPYCEGPADVAELAVRRRSPRRGVARRMHAELTAELSEERITLLVRPDAPTPRHAYRSWGYYSVGRPPHRRMIKPRTAAALRDLIMLLV
ncbi:MAG: hypothetical protein ACT4NY_21085 [Pseudonocardiales bacterium]